jgi:hypothetical protein
MKPFRGRRQESTGERMLAEELGARRAVGLNRPRSRRRLSVSFGFRYVPANVEWRLDQTAPAPPFEDEDDDEDYYEARPPSS